MKVFLKRLAHVKKRQIAKKVIKFGAAAWAFKFGAINSYPPPTPVDSGQYTQRLEAQYSYQKTATVDDDEQSLTESQSVNSIRFKTGSGAVINIRNQQSQKPGEDLIITVDATNNEYISVRNATDFQLEKVDIDGNLGYDSRPSMSVTLRLRGPKQ
jgi:hypothetical protein